MGKFFRLLLLVHLIVVLSINGGNCDSSPSVSGTKLKIGVPKKDGFTQFVDVRWDPQKQKYNVSGYCIDVFNAVVNVLPFNVSYEFIPYVAKSGESAGTYDSLVQQIPQQYHAVVGDVTIVASRSNYVDFTLPFTESGVSMVVKADHKTHHTIWIFLKPFSFGLWISILISCFLVGAFVFIMEELQIHEKTTTTTHNNNNDDDDQPQVEIIHVDATTSRFQTINKWLIVVVTLPWFPISQAVLPDRHVVAKKSSRFVLTIWLLLAFILMQSYTASLSSMLTLDQLQPSFMSVNDLRNGGYYVGYQDGSFVSDLLVQRLKFDPSKLRAYSTVAEYHNALQKGSNGGGVAAIFDEIPYLRIFLNKFGSDYMMAGFTYRTDGFGFAFPLNSNLTSFFSRAILNVIESDIMDEIEKIYLGDNNSGGQVQSSQTQSSSSSSNTAILTFHSFQGLFYVTGSVTLFALLLSVFQTFIWKKVISKTKSYSGKYGSRRLQSSTTPNNADPLLTIDAAPSMPTITTEGDPSTTTYDAPSISTKVVPSITTQELKEASENDTA